MMQQLSLLSLYRLFGRKAVSRDEILDRAWSADEFPTSRTVDNFIVRLRRYIEVDPSRPEHLVTVRGVGYVLRSAAR